MWIGEDYSVEFEVWLVSNRFEGVNIWRREAVEYTLKASGLSESEVKELMAEYEFEKAGYRFKKSYIQTVRT